MTSSTEMDMFTWDNMVTFECEVNMKGRKSNMKSIYYDPNIQED